MLKVPTALSNVRAIKNPLQARAVSAPTAGTGIQKAQIVVADNGPKCRLARGKGCSTTGTTCNTRTVTPLVGWPKATASIAGTSETMVEASKRAVTV